MSDNDKISEPVMNVFSDLDLPFEAKAVEIADSVLHGKFYFPALVPAIASGMREITESLSRKLEEARREATLHKEIADAREFDFHEAEKRIADLTIEADKHVEEITRLRNDATEAAGAALNSSGTFGSED